MSDIETYMREQGWLPPGLGRRGHLKTEPGPFARYGWQDRGKLRWVAGPTLYEHGSERWCGFLQGWCHWRGVYCRER